MSHNKWKKWKKNGNNDGFKFRKQRRDVPRGLSRKPSSPGYYFAWTGRRWEVKKVAVTVDGIHVVETNPDVYQNLWQFDIKFWSGPLAPPPDPISHPMGVVAAASGDGGVVGGDDDADRE